MKVIQSTRMSSFSLNTFSGTEHMWCIRHLYPWFSCPWDNLLPLKTSFKRKICFNENSWINANEVRTKREEILGRRQLTYSMDDPKSFRSWSRRPDDTSSGSASADGDNVCRIHRAQSEVDHHLARLGRRKRLRYQLQRTVGVLLIEPVDYNCSMHVLTCRWAPSARQRRTAQCLAAFKLNSSYNWHKCVDAATAVKPAQADRHDDEDYSNLPMKIS